MRLNQPPRFLALACDYDGTIAHNGRVDDKTVHALEGVRKSRRHLILVTGRRLPDLQPAFTRLDLFDLVVAENGALLFDPKTREETLLGAPPPDGFVEELRKRKVEPIEQGRVIVATWTPHETATLEAIRDLGLELHVIFNKGAVMILPSGVNKAVGLSVALEKLQLSPHNTVGVGDAENDHAFLELCGCSVAVANALPSLKEHADIVTEGERGTGVQQLIDGMLGSDLLDLYGAPRKPFLSLGHVGDESFLMPMIGENLLIAGASGGGKSTFAKLILENLLEHQGQFCVLDPEGDYEGFPDTITLGDGRHEPSLDEVKALLSQPDQNLIVELTAVPLNRRPDFLGRFLKAIESLRESCARPHRLVLDEGHHLLPVSKKEPANLSPHRGSIILLTVYPEHVDEFGLAEIDRIIIVGEKPEKTLRSLAETTGRGLPDTIPEPKEGEAWSWRLDQSPVIAFQPGVPSAEHKRHRRNYAAGVLLDELCFYFTGPHRKMNLKAENLIKFLELGDGVDDRTWLYHLKRGDYSRWFRSALKDEELANVVGRIEGHADIDAGGSRAFVRDAIEMRYTAPA